MKIGESQLNIGISILHSFHNLCWGHDKMLLAVDMEEKQLNLKRKSDLV